MIATIHLRQDGERTSFQGRAEAALRALSVRPGYVRGSVARATDDEDAWLLLIEWESVGAYRRALGGYDVKLVATPLMATALDQPSAFEELFTVGADGAEQRSDSDRAGDADWVARTLRGGPG